MRRLLVPFLILVASCVGDIGDAPDTTDPPGGTGAAATPETDLRRLTRHEYERALRDLFGDAAVDDATLALEALPSDRPSSGAFARLPFSTEARGVTASHVDAHYRIAEKLADHYRLAPDGLEVLEACLPAQIADEACVRTFITSFGRRVARRPLQDGEVESLVESYSDGLELSNEDGIALVILHLLESPAFLYRLELAGPATDEPEVFSLSGYELATRLSFLAWGTTPDVELLDAAESGELETEAGLEAATERLFGHERAAAHAESFFYEWLNLAYLPPINQDNTFLDGIDRYAVTGEMQVEIAAMANRLFAEGGTFEDLMLSRTTTIPGASLALLYGVEPGQNVTLPESYAGIATRAGFLMVGPDMSTHPIRRGAAVRRQLLCDAIAPPDPSDFPPNSIVPPAYDPTKSARERWTAQTSGAACSGCHERVNPPGFALEVYDPIGRYRTEEVIFDPVTMEEVSEIPIDAEVEIALPGDETVVVNGGVGLSQALAASEESIQCFAKQAVRFTEGRLEGTDDAVMLAAMVEALGADGLRVMFEGVARSDGFRFKRSLP